MFSSKTENFPNQILPRQIEGSFLKKKKENKQTFMWDFDELKPPGKGTIQLSVK